MIIHSPVISGSLTFADGATFTLPDNGVYSGSFSGSINGIGDPETFSSSIATDFSNLSSNFDDLVDNPFTQSADAVTLTKNLVPETTEIDLGSPSVPFKDLYLSSASLFINGTQVLSTDAGDLTLTTDADQSLRIVESGVDTITLQSENGDITLTSTGTGNIELDAPIQIQAGKKILSSDGNNIQFGNGLSITGSITLTGTVDGIDLQAFSGSVASDFAALSPDYNDLQNIPAGIVSGSSQIDLSGVNGDTDDVSEGSTNLYYTDARVKSKLDSETVISGSSQVTITESQISDFGSYITTNSAQGLNDGTALSLATNTLTLTKADGTTDTVSLVQYLDEDSRSIASGVLNGSTGIVTFTRDDSTTFTLDLSDLLDDTNLVTSVNGLNGVVTLDTDDISEGSNLYYTDARVNSHLSGGTGVTYSDGTISIGQSVGTSSTVQFGKIGVGNPADATYELKVTGDIGATGDIVAYISSDERLKDNIELISSPVEKVQELRGVTWEWNDEASDAAKDSPNVGVIAQDVEKVLPQLVHDRENGYKGVDYSKLTGLLIEAVKEQQDHISRLEERLSKLEG